MSKTQNYVCDYDGEILLGLDRKSLKRESYIHIQGKITAQMKDEDTGHRYYVFITDHADQELSFHRDRECFALYCDRKIESRQVQRRQALMDGVNGVEKHDRPVWSSADQPRRPGAPAPAPAPQRG